MKTTKLVCPKCGAEIAIPEHESFVAGIAIGKDSGLGTVTLPLADESNPDDVGSIVSRLNNKDDVTAFPVNVDADTKVGIVEDGIVNVYDLDDPIIKAILGEGTVENAKLFRRNILAMLMRAEKHGGIHYALKRGGYEYMWKMLTEEFHVQSRLFLHDDTHNFGVRNAFFNRELAALVASEYIDHIRDIIDDAEVKTYNHRPYKRIGSYNVFRDEIDKRIINPLLEHLLDIKNAETPFELYVRFRDFRTLPELTSAHGNYKCHDCKIKLPYNTPLCKAFVDAYKGVGGYYAADNMIKFSHARVRKPNIVLNEQESLDALNECFNRAKNYGAGYLLYGFWRELVNDNDWDFDAKFEQWRKERDARRARNRK